VLAGPAGLDEAGETGRVVAGAGVLTVTEQDRSSSYQTALLCVGAAVSLLFSHEQSSS
jgi:hypothetical protein